MTPGSLSRRNFLAASAASAATAAQPSSAPLKVSIFSKHLHWAGWKEMAEVAREIGFDAIDLTVRKGGHVLPERAAEDLPQAAAAARAAGLEISMITTEISGPDTPHAETMLRTASELGIRYYRWGGLRYQPDRPLPAQIEGWKPAVRKLEELSERYRMHGMFHTHSGLNYLGAPQWDLWMLFHQTGVRYLGYNYDVGHATVEGGFGGWLLSTRLALPMMKGVALKDFTFARNPRASGARAGAPWEKGWSISPSSSRCSRKAGSTGRFRFTTSTRWAARTRDRRRSPSTSRRWRRR